MILKEFADIKEEIKIKRPLIHAITNPISINQCANAILALGARPVMAEHPEEVMEITKTASLIMLNLGNITDARIKSMKISAKAASEEKIPCVIDVVGVACSKLRRDLANELIEKNNITLLKGNYSEIAALYNPEYKASGVDAEEIFDVENITRYASELSKKQNTLVLASGKVDIITDGEKVIYINNGTNKLSIITGTGCMQGAILSCFLSVKKGLIPAAFGAAMFGICGELSETEKGPGTFMVNLMDNLSTLSVEKFEKHIDMEEKQIEEV